MAHMPNAPLIYTLGIVRFPRVPDFHKYPDRFFEQIRKQYPYDEKFKNVTMSADFGPNGVTLNQNEKDIWQYLSENKDCGFLLSDDMIAFHTSNYIDSTKFLERFKFGLGKLVGVEGLGVTLITSLGIRYLDLVVPEDSSPLTEYVEGWVLPKDNPVEGVAIQEGAYMAKYRTDMGFLNFQAVRNPESLFPPDLQSPFLHKNGWFKEKPSSGDFAVIDTDHVMEVSGLNNKFDPDQIVRNLDSLHVIPKRIFAALGTTKAKNYWEGRK